jgi:tetratricopeptide (TPR) repeat protein
MLMLLRVVLASLAICAVSSAQVVLKGVVLENEVGGSPAPGVQITSTGANPTNTGADGQFTLVFPKMEPGDAVRLAAAKAGYVVVNDVQLEQALPKPGVRPLLILICRQASREEMARRYYRLRSLEVIEANYQKRLGELQSTNSEAIARLQQERDQARSAAEKMAEELAKAKPGQTSELYNQAMRLFLDGQIEEALKILDEERLRRNLAAAKQRKAEAEKEIEQAAQSWVLKARVLTIQFRFADAEAAYGEALQAAPNSFDVNFAFAVFNMQPGRYAVAVKSFDRCLNLARQKGDQAGGAETLRLLGVLDWRQNRTDEALRAWEGALRIYRELARTGGPEVKSPPILVVGADGRTVVSGFTARLSPEFYLPDVAETLGLLGVLYWGQGQIEEARQADEEALKIRRELARKNPETYLPGVAYLLNVLGAVYKNQNRIDEARQAYDEALGIYKSFAALDPKQFQAEITQMNALLAGLGK